VLISATSTTRAAQDQVGREVQQILDRRGALAHAPVTLAISDPVALAIAGMFSSSTEHGQVLDRLCRTGTADSHELIEAAEFERGYASAEGHAALFSLIGWARAKVHQRQAR
jgi:hypothetical protein